MNLNLNASKRETELQKLLNDERTRAEQHKINYQLLKAEHKRLQEEFNAAQFTLRDAANAIQDDKHHREENELLMKDVERELIEAKSKINELQSQILTPLEIEVIKKKCEDECYQTFADSLKKAEDEAAKYSEDYRTLVYKMTAFQTESEQVMLAFQATLSELKLQNDIEVSQLRKRCEAAEKKVFDQEVRKSDTRRVQDREIIILKERVKGLQQELKDKQDNLAQQLILFEEHRKECSQKLSSLHNQLRSTEMEKSSLKEELERVEKQLKDLYDENSKLRMELSDSKAIGNRLQVNVNDLEKKLKLEAIDQHDNLQKEKDEWENEYDNLNHLVKELKLELEVAEKQITKQDEKQVKQQHLIQELQTSQIQEKEIINQLNIKIMELETQLKKAKDETTKREEAQNSLKSLLSDLEVRVDEKQRMVDRWHDKYVACQQETEKLRSYVKMMNDAENQLLERNKELNDALSLIQRKQSTSEEYKSLSRLKRRNSKLNEKLNRVTKTSKKKMKKYSKLIVKLRNKLDLQKAEMDQLTIEKEALRCGVPHEIHKIVTKKLHNLQQRNDEFRQILNLYGGNSSIPEPGFKAKSYIYQSDHAPKEDSRLQRDCISRPKSISQKSK
ncbi:Centrosomal protein of 83 kDa [Chamberlinius hualienensis]